MADGGAGFADGTEVVQQARGYWRWPNDVKARIVNESFQPGVRVVDVARRHSLVVLIVQTELKLDPHSGVTIIFRSKRGDRLKILVWDGTGLVMVYKVLEQGSFAWPKVQDVTMRLSRAQHEALFEGLDLRRIVAQRIAALVSAG